MQTGDNLKMADKLYEARKITFEDFEKDGYKYIARDKDGAIFAYSSKPTKLERAWFIIPVDGTWQNISFLSPIFTDIKWEDEKPFEIPYTNWDDVPVDTKVIVTGVDGSEWKCHFCKKYDCSTVSVFLDGKTSWTTDDVVDNVVEVDINNVRLA